VWIALVVVVVTPLSFLIARFIARKTYSMFKLQSETRGEQTAFIDEMLGNQKTVEAYSRGKENIKRFDEINERLGKYSLRAVFYSSITNPATRFVNSIVYAAVALFGAVLAVKTQQQAITVGVLASFLAYANQYTKPFNEISGVVTELQNAFACAARLFELLEEKSVEPDSENARELGEIDGRLELKDVCFSYNENKKLIEDFNLSVNHGERVAIVGPTGCGKTTLINLLMRFYDPQSGKIALDGSDYREIKRKSLREAYGMVLQDTWLKSGTIKENIIIGAPDATDEEIIEAAKKAHAHSFIKRLENGYDTVIGEDGGSLSQGQKQLLCITRLMLCKPPMLILDEATSSIDTRTEIKIQKAFSTLMLGRTSFIVAHRLATIKEADVILVMRDGNIVEQGRHSELLKRKGFYYELYNSQFPRFVK
ncbi:MAG: ABC transporter ATP-binding protein, partial [Eubacterium sp.]|nr:ABC transporter ATP-binding protein [Eubacterium sp.]